MLNSKFISKEKIKSFIQIIDRKKALILYLLVFTNSIYFTYAQWLQTNGPHTASAVTCIAISGTNIFAGTSG